MSFENQTELFRQNLLGEFKKTSCYKNPNTNGAIKEDFVRSALEPKVPSIIGLGKGEIIDFNGLQTGEHDIVLFDKFYSPLFESFQSQAIYYVETVAGVIEVKSDYSLQALGDAITKSNEVAQLTREFRPTNLAQYLAGVIGIGGSKTPISIQGRQSQNGVNSIFAGAIFFRAPAKSQTVMGHLAQCNELDFCAFIESSWFFIRNRQTGAWTHVPTSKNVLNWLLQLLYQFSSEFRSQCSMFDTNLQKYQ